MKGSNYESSPDAVFCSHVTTVYLPQAPDFFFSRVFVLCSVLKSGLHFSSRLKAKNLKDWSTVNCVSSTSVRERLFHVGSEV
jgi:hypothetical protein